MLTDNERQWYYFGCRYGPGHYLFDKDGRSAYVDDLSDFDGKLCLKETPLYKAVIYRIPQLNYTSLAWWDQTVDRRPGSNSIIFAPSLIASKESILFAMDRWFPWVKKRLPKPLTIVDEEYTWPLK